MSHARGAHSILELLALLFLETQNEWEAKQGRECIEKLLALLLLEERNDWQTTRGGKYILKLLALVFLETLIQLSVRGKSVFHWQVTCSPLG